MSISHVSGLGCENKSQRIGSLSKEGVEINRRPKIVANHANTTDRVRLSPEAQRAYQENNKAESGNNEFKNNFMEALTKFTSYAYHLNGYAGEPTGKHAYLALAVLADKSGFKLPENMNHENGATLNKFMTQWNLSENSSMDEIYSTMVRVFGEDTSFGMEGGSQNSSNSMNPGNPFASGSPAVGVSQAPVTEADPTTGTNPNLDIREALQRFTNELFEKNGISRPPEGKDFSRVANIILDKLNVDSGMNLAEALGLKDSDSISDIYRAMKQAFYT